MFEKHGIISSDIIPAPIRVRPIFYYEFDKSTVNYN